MLKRKVRETARPDVELVLSKKMVYDEVVEKLGETLSWDPAKIRLSTNSSIASKQSIKRSEKLTLSEMMQVGYYSSLATPGVLYFELLETKRVLKLYFADRHLREHGPYDVLVMKSAHAGEVLAEVRGKLPIEAGGSGQLRLFEVTNFKIHKIFTDEDFISTISEYSTVYVEETPIEELRRTEADRFVPVFHFTKEPARGHSIPFTLLLIPGEPFAATKERILARLGLTDKDLAKMKFFVVPTGYSKPKPIEDSDILSDIEFMPNDYLGIDHVDRSGRSGRTAGVERAIKIFN
ncbi:hypothetical protein HDU76_006355 [Blyttiomyces sp. JEL0837]|nr:hypothetical protein HDU76_006355 [Blyttiomyces sp. JEL0837]